MKELADGSQVQERVYHYLLDWNESNHKDFMKNSLGHIRLADLNIKEFTLLFERAVKTDSYFLGCLVK